MNHDESLDPSDCAIWPLGIMSSLAMAGSALARGDLAAFFSEASIDNGRLRGPACPCDVGRCCHERVPARARGIAALGDVSESVWGFEGV